MFRIVSVAMNTLCGKLDFSDDLLVGGGMPLAMAESLKATAC
jgi:hypothetical protein